MEKGLRLVLLPQGGQVTDGVVDERGWFVDRRVAFGLPRDDDIRRNRVVVPERRGQGGVCLSGITQGDQVGELFKLGESPSCLER